MQPTLAFNSDITVQSLFTLASVLVAAMALLFGMAQARERQLRKDDVLKWANECIRSLQTLYLVCFLGDGTFDRQRAKELLAEIAVNTSVLVEQGRLFFRNTPDPEHGKDRHPAYRGYRPLLLDPLVVAHQIACQWEGADDAERLRMIAVAEDCVRGFVSMAQVEVGRVRTADADTAKRGEGEKLEVLLGRVSAERLKALGANARLSL